LLDQANRSHAFSHFDSPSGAVRPGLFHLSILGVGHIAASDGFVTLLALRHGNIIRDSVAVLEAGPIRTQLAPHISAYISRVEAASPGEAFEEPELWRPYLTQRWLETIARLLNRVQAHSHGGAILITPDSEFQHLNLKYSLTYTRLREALESWADSGIRERIASEAIWKIIDADTEDLPVSLHLDEAIERNLSEESSSEMDGALWFVSLLTRVDGLVVVRPDLTVAGFGAEITATTPPRAVYVARDRNATTTRLRAQAYEHYGTRHRSMMRYCSAVPGSLGFVVSQDGPIRAISCVGNRLVIWENLKLSYERFARIPKPRHVRANAT
jgi:hypothetical protein